MPRLKNTTAYTIRVRALSQRLFNMSDLSWRIGMEALNDRKPRVSRRSGRGFSGGSWIRDRELGLYLSVN
jgi:hypothetical protein